MGTGFTLLVSTFNGTNTKERGQNEDSNADITNGFCSSLLKLEKDKEASKDPKNTRKT